MLRRILKVGLHGFNVFSLYKKGCFAMAFGIDYFHGVNFEGALTTTAKATLLPRAGIGPFAAAWATNDNKFLFRHSYYPVKIKKGDDKC